MAGGIEYVAGLLFSEDAREVALIRKLKPAWQAGRLNAIGGKIEPGETPAAAMAREFDEEAGVSGLAWEPVAVLYGEFGAVHFFACRSAEFWHVRTMEAEAVERWPVASALASPDLIPNLRVVVAIALDQTGIFKPVGLIQREDPAS